MSPNSSYNGYAFATTPAELIDAQLSCIQSCYDPPTIAGLTALGVGPGWRCWEVGAGRGSIASWLADRVAPGGQVIATDLNTSLGPVRPGLPVQRHDITRDDPPASGFDLIHARLVLQHLPERQKLVAQLAAALRPGGWLVLEDFDCAYLPTLAGEPEHARLYDRVTSTLLSVLTAAGADIYWGARTYEAAVSAGLVDVTSTSYSVASPGGSPGAVLFAVNARQLSDKLRDAGLSETELETYQSLLADRSFAVASYMLTSTRARREDD